METSLEWNAGHAPLKGESREQGSLHQPLTPQGKTAKEMPDQEALASGTARKSPSAPKVVRTDSDEYASTLRDLDRLGTRTRAVAVEAALARTGSRESSSAGHARAGHAAHASSPRFSKAMDTAHGGASRIAESVAAQGALFPLERRPAMDVHASAHAGQGTDRRERMPPNGEDERGASAERATATLANTSDADAFRSGGTAHAVSAGDRTTIGCRQRSWREWLAGGSSREVLARIVQEDPLGVREHVARALKEGCYLLDGQRVGLRCFALVARHAVRYRGRPDLEEWLAILARESVLAILRDDQEAERRPLVPGREPGREHGEAFAALAQPLGLEPGAMGRACLAFNRLPHADRAAFFALVIASRVLEELVRESGESPTDIARRARRALDAILMAAGPVVGSAAASEGGTSGSAKVSPNPASTARTTARTSAQPIGASSVAPSVTPTVTPTVTQPKTPPATSTRIPIAAPRSGVASPSASPARSKSGRLDGRAEPKKGR